MRRNPTLGGKSTSERWVSTWFNNVTAGKTWVTGVTYPVTRSTQGGSKQRMIVLENKQNG